MSMSSTKLNKTSWTVPTPEDYVNANLRTIGLEVILLAKRRLIDV
jgi:hypothetical protein